MVRTQIQLTEKQSRRIKAVARQRNVSMAAVIRECVDVGLRRSAPDRRELWKRAERFVGAFADRAYGRLPHNAMLQHWIGEQSFLTSTSQPQPGDVLLMRFGREPQHLAICAGETIIHSYEKAGPVVEHNLDATWRRRIVAVYRFEDVQA